MCRLVRGQFTDFGCGSAALPARIAPVDMTNRSSALQRVTLALVLHSHKRRFAPGDLQFLTRSTYHRAQLLEIDRLA
jgi:hypothetical protein